MDIFKKIVIPFVVLALLVISPDVADAQGRGGGGGPGGGGGGPGGGVGGPGGGGGGGGGGGLPPIYAWMHPDVGLAFDPGQLGGSFTGVGSHMVILDNFSRGSLIRGNLTGKRQRLYHGQWTSLEARLVAPDATHTNVDNLSGGVISDHFSPSGLQSVNLSFGLLDPAGSNVNAPGYSLGTTMWDSLVTGASAADAVYVKAAGNEGGVAIDGYFSGLPYGILGNVQDSLNLQLIGKEGAVFVGALERNGSSSSPAPLASYSTYAGAAAASQYVVVGVDSGITGLAGTSFAAPIVTGYAAIIGDKFESASPAAVVDQLLATAREDTVLNYNSTIHGMGEACLSCALSPISIPN